VIALCEYHLSILAESLPEVSSKASLIPPPCNIQFVPDNGDLRRMGREQAGASAEELLVGYMGYIYQHKGVDTLIESFREVLDSGLKARLIVLGGGMELVGEGEGYFDKIVSLARSAEIEHAIHWHGAFDPSSRETAMLIHAADFFVLPFDNGVHLNNSSIASLLTYGKPVISTLPAQLDSALENERPIMLVEPRNPRVLADAITRLAHDENLQADLSARAVKFAERYFSWDNCVSETLSCLTE
jgi:glycosyltransferase involved in cell wall biosynthesis